VRRVLSKQRKEFCLQSVSHVDKAGHAVHTPPVPRKRVFTFVVQLHKYRPSLPGTSSARVFTYTQLSYLVICAVKLVAPSCSRRPYRSLCSGRMGAQCLYLEGETSALLVNTAGAVERTAMFVVCCFYCNEFLSYSFRLEVSERPAYEACWKAATGSGPHSVIWAKAAISYRYTQPCISGNELGLQCEV